MSMMQGYMFDEATGTIVDTLDKELGWKGPLADSYYEPLAFSAFGSTGTVSVKSASLNVPSPSAIDFEIVTRTTDGTVTPVITGTMPPATVQTDAAGLNLSAASVNNPVASTGWGIRPVGGFQASALRPKLVQLPAALRAVIGDASGFTVNLQIALS